MSDVYLSTQVKTDQASSPSWLQQYRQVLANADKFQIHTESREFYAHPSQLLPDYLDYKEEWEYATDEMMEDLIGSFIYRMASKNLAMQCQCGKTHTLGLYVQRGVGNQSLTIVDNPAKPNFQECWYKTITQSAESVKARLSTGMANFPNVIEHNLALITQWSLAKTGKTPALLPFEVFREVWWPVEVAGGSTELSQLIIRLMGDQSRFAIANHQIKKPVVERYFFKSEEVVGDHGFHNFYSSVQDQGAMLKYMNRLRREVGAYGARITVGDTETAMKECGKCKWRRMTSMSVFGIYVALPGAGKTTAQHNNLFVGFDTDWIGVGPTWRDYSYLLRLGIPVITNQPHLFEGAGVKIQLFTRSRVRRDARGRPMGDFKATAEWGKNNPDVVVHDIEGGFVSDAILQAQMCAHVQNINIELFINRKTIFDDEGTREWLNEYGRRMRNLAVGKVQPHFLIDQKGSSDRQT